MTNLTWNDIYILARKATNSLTGLNHKVYGIPRGGIFAAQAVMSFCPTFVMVDDPSEATLFIDDIIDSEKTKQRYTSKFPGVPFHALWTKKDKDEWIVFPWERMTDNQGPEENIVRLLQYIGEDANREGLLETPKRVLKSYGELFKGYKQDPSVILKTFEDGSTDEMVVCKSIQFYSTCEHHMLPFHGIAHIGYLPKGKIIGLSKLARIMEIYSRRLQVQERLTQQITKALDDHLNPMGSACVIEATHLCMAARGIQKQGSKMVTSSMTGAFRDNPETRAEFLNLVRTHS